MLHYFRMFQFQILKRDLLLLSTTKKKKRKRKILPTAHATSSGKLNIKYSSIFMSQNEYPEERFFEYLSYKCYKKKKKKNKVTELSLSLSLYRKFHLKFRLKSTSYIKFTLKFSVYKTFLLRYNRGTSAPTVSKEIFPEF